MAPHMGLLVLPVVVRKRVKGPQKADHRVAALSQVALLQFLGAIKSRIGFFLIDVLLQVTVVLVLPLAI